jgi:purine-binding chemotaxis protein CheW
MRALLMPLGDEWYAVDAERVKEVTAEPRPTRLPGAQPGVLGVINLRGEIVPLMDTAALLGLEVPADLSFAVVVHTADGPAALTATGMPEVVTLDDELGRSDLPGSTNRYRFGSRLVVVLDVDEIVTVARGASAAGGTR